MERQTRKRWATLFLAFMASSPVAAQEKALIWQPSRIGKNAYSLRVGMTLPWEVGARAGLDFDMKASDSGAVREVPTRLWSSWTNHIDELPGRTARRDLNMDFNLLTGSGTVRLNYLRKWIATPSIDMELLQSYSSFYSGPQNAWNGINTSQSVRLVSSSGTSVTLRGLTSSSFEDIRTSFGLEQKLGRHMTIRGDLDHSGETLNTRFSAKYTIKW